MLLATPATFMLKDSRTSRQKQPLSWTLPAWSADLSAADGIALSELIDIACVLVFRQAVGIRCLSVYLALIGGVGARLASLSGRRRN